MNRHDAKYLTELGIWGENVLIRMIAENAMDGETDMYHPSLGARDIEMLEYLDFDVEYNEHMGEYKISWD